MKQKLPVILINLNGDIIYEDKNALDSLRSVEMASFDLYANNNYHTYMSFDQRSNSVLSAKYSIYTTSFIIVLLLVSLDFFSLFE